MNSYDNMTMMEVTHQDIKEVKEKVAAMENRFEKMENTLMVVYYAVVGNEVAGGGFAKRIDALEKNAEELKARMDESDRNAYKRGVWVNIAWTCVGAVAMAILSLIISHAK